MKIYVSHSSNQEYAHDLYAALKSSAVANHHHIFFPHDTGNSGAHSKQVIQDSDLVIAEVSSASTGQGIELGWADEHGTPILCLYKMGSKISNSLQFISDWYIEYNDASNMIEQLEQWIKEYEQQ